MRLSVATNFDDELIWKIKNFPVEEIYGKLPRDFVGGGRSSYMLSPLSKKRLVRHIDQAHKCGIKFNYLLNSACLHYYEELGYDNFKLVERNAPTPVMVERVRAYAERRYKGNLLDLIQPFAYKDGISSNGHRNRVTPWALRFFLRPGLVNPFRLRKILELAKTRLANKMSSDMPPVYVDNEKLNGFLTFFLNESCRNKDCRVCRYCHEQANKAVKIDPQYQRMCLDGYQEVMEDIYSGKVWQ